MSVIDKVPQKEVRADAAEFACDDDGFGDQYPGIFEILARQRYQGNPRKTGKLLFFVDYGKASLCITDVCTGQVAFYKAGSFGEALEGLERALQGGTVDWRPDRRSR